MPFNDSNSEEAGRKGGSSRSDAKRKAARKNGRKGGRKASRTLAERLLGRKLTEWQQTEISKAWTKNQFLLMDESRALLEHFGLDSSAAACPYDSQSWRRKSGRMPRKIRYLAAKFKLAALYYIEKAEAKPVKDYMVVTRQATRYEIEEWEQRHPGTAVPCPPYREKRYFRHLPDFHLVSLIFQKNPDMTAAELKELGGGAYTAAVENGLLQYLTSITKKAS